MLWTSSLELFESLPERCPRHGNRPEFMPTAPLTGPVMPGREPSGQPEPDSIEDIASYWDVDMGSDVAHAVGGQSGVFKLFAAK
jgi:hypothetical protein